jgi:hypothetical protein
MQLVFKFQRCTRLFHVAEGREYQILNSEIFRIKFSALTCSRRLFESISNKIKKLRGLSPRENRRLLAKLVPTFENGGCHVVSATDSRPKQLI